MNGYVFTSQASAQACAPVVDAAKGYPKAGVDIGGGVHAPPALSVTTTYAAPIQNAANALQWAYLSDVVTDAALLSHAVALGLPAPTALPATWFPTAVGG